VRHDYTPLFVLLGFIALTGVVLGTINAAVACPTGTTFDPSTQFCCSQVSYGSLVAGQCYTQTAAWAAFKAASGGG
jgi:hypothetical protein